MSVILWNTSPEALTNPFLMKHDGHTEFV